MDIESYSWNWFERSGHPGAYMEYRQAEKTKHKLHSARALNENSENEHL